MTTEYARHPAVPSEHRAAGAARLFRLLAGLRSIAIVVVISAIAGAATPFGQQYLPDALRSLANSSGSWTAVAMLAVWASRSRVLLGALLGAVSFVLLNETYGVVSGLRGFPYQGGMASFWNLIALVAGPVVGVSAVWLRSRSMWARAVGGATLPAVLIGEGIYGLVVVADTTSPVYWWLQIVGGIVFAVVLGLRMRDSVRAPSAGRVAGAAASVAPPVALNLGLTVLGAAVFYLGYTGA